LGQHFRFPARPLGAALVLALTLGVAPAVNAQIKINEIYPNPPGTETGFDEMVEIFNAGTTAVDMSGWAIDDAVTISTSATRCRIPEDLVSTCSTNPVIGPGEVRLVRGQASAAWLNNSGGDTVYLISDRALNTVVDVVTYPDASTESGMVWSCIPNGTTNFAWRSPTLCALNAPLGDVTSPAAVTDLAAAPGEFPGEIRLTWTAPGDDGATGTASGYTIKVDHAPITSGTFGAAADLDRWIIEFAPHVAGTPETLYVAGMDPDSTWYFALESSDEVPNVSGVSNSPGTVPGGGTRLNPDLGFSTFYGNLHSHTSYSDGVETPPDAYAFARTGAPTPLDFLAVTDHNHASLGMTPALYHTGLAQGDAANDDGNFVAIYGQEWGIIDHGGHANVFEAPVLFGWDTGNYDVFVADGNYTGLYTAFLANPPAADPPIVEWCHPNSGDFNGYAVTDDGKAAVHLMAMISGPAFSTSVTESDQGSTTGNEILFQDALRKGFRVSPTGDQDNHEATWGASTPARTAVLASGLTRSQILTSLAARRCYATMDHNTVVQFSADTHAMGEAWTAARGIRIAAHVADPDVGETVSQIDLLRGITGVSDAVVVASSIGSPDFAWREHQSFAQGTEAHYYLRIRMSNNASVWTGPVYVTYDPSAVTAVAPREPGDAIALAVGPNPAYGRVSAAFTLPHAARRVDLAIYDASGRRVKSLLSGPVAAGPQAVTWTGRDDGGHAVPSGIFFLKLEADGRAATRKVLMIR